MFDMNSFDHLDISFKARLMGESLCHYILQQESVQKLIHSTDIQFDVLIVEAFVKECFLGFAHKFQAPIIQVCSYVGESYMADWVGNPNPYSYVPDQLVDYADKMNFWQRTHNTIVYLLKHMERQLIHVPKKNAAMKKYFNCTHSLPPVWELEQKTSLVLVNTHHSLGYPKL
jgi:glucuronosyltransferase